MKKMVKVAALFAAVALATAAFAEDFPEYLIVADKILWNYRNGLPAELVIPKGIVAIGEDAFKGCSNLKSVVIPDSVTSIGRDSFCGCGSLASVTIGNGMTIINYKMFYGCGSLDSVTIPATVTKIELGAFSYCPNLKDVKYTGTKAQWAKIIKNDIGISRFVVHCTDGDVFVR
ncbi:MAG: leucine-rich repeat domain-containing protein [Treponema sp.]|nr:leucine-rich repeat domain-containing protein [Treponema sp.]